MAFSPEEINVVMQPVGGDPTICKTRLQQLPRLAQQPKPRQSVKLLLVLIGFWLARFPGFWQSSFWTDLDMQNASAFFRDLVTGGNRSAMPAELLVEFKNTLSPHCQAAKPTTPWIIN